jgi:hypothetical protein
MFSDLFKLLKDISEFEPKTRPRFGQLILRRGQIGEKERFARKKIKKCLKMFAVLLKLLV